MADMVVVDEASMVDLALMNRLVAAVPRRARLVLLGDRDQLSSVEAGAVLGDLCDAEALGRAYSSPHQSDLKTLGGINLPSSQPLARETGLRDSIVRLTHSYRYGEQSGIGRLAAAIREQRGADALAILESDEFPDVARVDPPAGGALHATLEQRVVAGFRAALEDAEAAAALRALDGFRVLCAHRRGPFGVETLNARIVEMLREAGLVRHGDGHYPGRAILVTRNDYTLSLFNGDVGLVVPDPDDRERLAVVARAPGGGVRLVSPARLPSHETAFAMTVHKSQGSEVDELVLVLPEKSPVVTRELLYTAVTRAKKSVLVQASREAIEEGIRIETRRASGLRDLLWATPMVQGSFSWGG
jgi:exodeoxyribonuclease V alpha subunit